PDRANYFVVDEEIWTHARPDLSDLRLYVNGQHDYDIPYKQVTQYGSRHRQHIDARVMQKGKSGDQTVFVLDMGATSEFNQVHLDVATKNFVAQAEVEGMDDIHEKKPLRMGPYTIFNFDREQLGSNLTLKLPDSSFRYLRVRLSKEVSPDDVRSA